MMHLSQATDMWLFYWHWTVSSAVDVMIEINQSMNQLIDWWAKEQTKPKNVERDSKL